MPHATPKQKSSLHLHDHLTDEPVPWAPFHSRRSVVYGASDNSGILFFYSSCVLTCCPR